MAMALIAQIALGVIVGGLTIVVEDASRFARDLVAQELGVLLLIKRNVRVLQPTAMTLRTPAILRAS
jgi:hypothetical protein